MSKKATPPKAHKLRRTSAPAGLRAAFSMITVDTVKPNTWATASANAAYPHAKRIVNTVLTDGDESTVVIELEHATASLFPNLQEEPALTTAQEAAFNVGFAACWLLMTTINGQGGAR